MTEQKNVAVLVDASKPEALEAVRALQVLAKANQEEHKALHDAQRAEMDEAIEKAGLRPLKQSHDDAHREMMERHQAAQHEAFAAVGAALGMEVQPGDSLTVDVEYLETLGFAVLKTEEEDENPFAGMFAAMEGAQVN